MIQVYCCVQYNMGIQKISTKISYLDRAPTDKRSQSHSFSLASVAFTAMSSSTPCFAAPITTRGSIHLLTSSTHSLHSRRTPRVAQRRTRAVVVSLDAPRERRKRVRDNNSTAESKIDLLRVVETPGGYIVDIEVFHRSNTTKHTVIVAKNMISELCAGLPSEAPPEKIVEFAFRFLMSKGQSLANTEGMQDSDVFPINYFSLRQIFYHYPEANEKIAASCKEFIES